MHGIEGIERYLHEHDDFLLATHLTPDGDALGSSLALMFALDTLGKRVRVFDSDGVPDSLKFLPGADRIISTLEGIDTSRMSLVLLDCNGPHRAGIEGVEFMRTSVIDHHETESSFGDVRWVEPQEPAVGLMIYRLMRHIGMPLIPETATNIYAAIAVDTGCFRYPNTTAACFEAAASLVMAGADPGHIADRLYNTWGQNRFELLGLALAALEFRGGIAFLPVRRAMFDITGTTYSDTENFVNFPMAIESVRVSVAMRERGEGLWRISLRSKGEANVAKVAERFEGGGHMNAAGCTLRGSEAEVKDTITKALA